MNGQNMLKCRQLRPVIVASGSDMGTKQLIHWTTTNEWHK